MIEVNYGINYDNSKGIQFALANRKLKIADERYPHVVLNATTPSDEINISQLDKCHLLVVRTTKPLAEDSPSKLMYQIGQNPLVELDAPLFLLGTWVKSFNPGGGDLKITFKIEPAPANDSKDEAEVEVAIGWTETL